MIDSISLISETKKEIKQKELRYYQQLNRSQQLFLQQNNTQKSLYVGIFGLSAVGIGVLLAKHSRFVKTLKKTIFFVYT